MLILMHFCFNFVPPTWKLHIPYCHNVNYDGAASPPAKKFAIWGYSLTMLNKFFKLLTTYLPRPWLVLAKEFFYWCYKGKPAYRWHFHYHLPSSSCQRSLWTTPSNKANFLRKYIYIFFIIMVSCVTPYWVALLKRISQKKTSRWQKKS